MGVLPLQRVKYTAGHDASCCKMQSSLYEVIFIRYRPRFEIKSVVLKLLKINDFITNFFLLILISFSTTLFIPIIAVSEVGEFLSGGPPLTYGQQSAGASSDEKTGKNMVKEQ